MPDTGPWLDLDDIDEPTLTAVAEVMLMLTQPAHATVGELSTPAGQLELARRSGERDLALKLSQYIKSRLREKDDPNV